jgi:2-alkenal reductase
MLAVTLALAGCAAAVQPDTVVLPAAPASSDQTPILTESRPPIADLADLQQAYIDVYQRVNPSVVNIRAVQPGSAETGTLPDFEIPGFPDLPVPEIPQGPSVGQGSGFVYDEQGHIVTNNHVIDGAEQIVVTFPDGTEAEATRVGADPDSDLAVIKVDIDPAQLTPVTLGSSDNLQVGQIVIAIGNPFGLEGSMTTGIVSGLGRLLATGAQTPDGQRFSIPDIIQTDAAINPGNSGGPLLDLAGNVIGVNTAIESPTRSSSGVGYSVPVDIVKQVVPELIASGRVEHPWLGLAGGDLTASVAQAMDLDPDQRGILIAEVVDDGPAAEAGLRGSSTETTINGLPARIGGDVVVGINGQPVQVFDDLLSYIVRETKVGQTVTLEIMRGGERQEVQVTLAARPAR